MQGPRAGGAVISHNQFVAAMAKVRPSITRGAEMDIDPGEHFCLNSGGVERVSEQFQDVFLIDIVSASCASSCGGLQFTGRTSEAFRR